MVTHACNPRPWRAKEGRWWIQGQLGLHSETLTQKKIMKKEEKRIQSIQQQKSIELKSITAREEEQSKGPRKQVTK
jgi:hypothetical protein